YQVVTTSSQNTNNESRIEFPLDNYANAIMHVSMAIDGDRMQIYSDDRKVLDAIVLDPNAPKHFFITTDNYRNNATAFISNLRIHGFNSSRGRRFTYNPRFLRAFHIMKMSRTAAAI